MRAKISLSAAFLFTLGFAAPSMAAKIYKWTDEKGQVHYSEQSPQNEKAVTIESNNKASGVEGLTPDMNKRLKDLEEKVKKEQAAKAEETTATQTEPKKRNYIPGMPYENPGPGPLGPGPAGSGPTGPAGLGIKGGY